MQRAGQLELLQVTLQFDVAAIIVALGGLVAVIGAALAVRSRKNGAEHHDGDGPDLP